MTVIKVEIERHSVTSSKPFDVVVAALKAAVGHPDMVEFAKATNGARTFDELEKRSSQRSGQDGADDVYGT